MLGRDDASKPPQEHQPGIYDKVMGVLGFGGKPQEKPETAASGAADTSTSQLSKPTDARPADSSSSSSDISTPTVEKRDSGKLGGSNKPLHPDAYPLAATTDTAVTAPSTEYTRPFSQELKGPQSSHAAAPTGVEGVTHGVERVNISQTETPTKEDIKASQPTAGVASKSDSISSSSSLSSSEASEAKEHAGIAGTPGITTPHVSSPTGVATAHGGTGKPGVVASSAVPAATVTAPSPGVGATTGAGKEQPSEPAYGTPGAHNAQGKKGMLEKVKEKGKNVVSVLQDKAHDTKQKVGEKLHKK